MSFSLVILLFFAPISVISQGVDSLDGAEFQRSIEKSLQNRRGLYSLRMGSASFGYSDHDESLYSNSFMSRGIDALKKKGNVLMSCEGQVKSGAIEGMVLGAIIGCVVGVLDTIFALFDNRGQGVQFFERLIGGILQGGSLGLLLGTVFSVIKYC